MKNKFIIVSLTLMFMIAGCTKSGKDFRYEEDTSYETELYGTYSYDFEDPEYSRNETYTFNPDGKYSHKNYTVYNDEPLYDIDESGEVISCNEISDGLFEIVLPEYFVGENVIVYKYRNMIGSLEETETSDGTTFEVPHEDGIPWSAANGTYVKKGDIIYSVAEKKDNYCFINFYITDSGLFRPEVYKKE